MCREVWSAALPPTVKGLLMRARELAAPFPIVELGTPAFDAARLRAGQDLPCAVTLDALLDRLVLA